MFIQVHLHRFLLTIGKCAVQVNKLQWFSNWNFVPGHPFLHSTSAAHKQLGFLRKIILKEQKALSFWHLKIKNIQFWFYFPFTYIIIYVRQQNKFSLLLLQRKGLCRGGRGRSPLKELTTMLLWPRLWKYTDTISSVFFFYRSLVFSSLYSVLTALDAA